MKLRALISFVGATALVVGVSACQQKQTEPAAEPAPAAPSEPANVTVTPPDVNVTVPPGQPAPPTSTTTESTTVTTPDPVTGDPGSVTSTTTTEKK